MATNSGDDTGSTSSQNSDTSSGQERISIIIEEGRRTNIAATVTSGDAGPLFSSVSSETVPITDRQSNGDDQTNGQTDGQTAGAPVMYFDDPECPIINVYYDEWHGFQWTERRKAAIYIIFQRDYDIVPGEWTLSLTDTYGTITFPSENATRSLEQPSTYQMGNGLNVREAKRLRFSFDRRYSETSMPGVTDERLNELERLDRGLTDPDAEAKRNVPTPMQLIITHTHGGTRRWSASIDMRVKGLDGSPEDVPVLRPSATRLCMHPNHRLPAGYGPTSLPESVRPSRDDCRVIGTTANGELQVDTPDPLPMIWNQLTEEERKVHGKRYRVIGFNSAVTARFNGGFRLFDPARVAVEVIESSPIDNGDSLAVECSFNGKDWRPMQLLGRILKGTESDQGAGEAHNFYILWRFAGLPRRVDVSANSGFRVRVRDLSVHPASLTEAERRDHLLPQYSGHPNWRPYSTTEPNPGSDLMDIVVLSEGLKKIRYLFVLDHSGSMRGSRITNLRRALKSALTALEQAAGAGTAEIEVGLRIFQHRSADSTAADLLNFSGWQSFANYVSPADVTPPETEPAPCGDGWIADPNSPAGKLLGWLCKQAEAGQTPLQQSVEKIPEDLGDRSPDVLDFVILLTDGLHTGLVRKPDPENPDGTIDAPVDDLRAGSAGMAKIVAANQLPDKLFVLGLELPPIDSARGTGKERQSLEFIRDETPIYVDQELLKHLSEAGVETAHQAAFVTAIRSAITGSRDYVTYGQMRTALDAIAIGTIPANAKATILAAARKRAEDRVSVQYVDRSSDLTRIFVDFVRDFVTGGRGCIECAPPRGPIPAVVNFGASDDGP